MTKENAKNESHSPTKPTIALAVVTIDAWAPVGRYFFDPEGVPDKRGKIGMVEWQAKLLYLSNLWQGRDVLHCH